MEWEHGGSFRAGDQTWDGSSGAMGAEPNQVVPFINCKTNSEIKSFEANTEAVSFERLFIQDPEELSTSSGGGASIFVVAMLATYLVSVYRKSAKCTSPKRAQEHDQNTVAEKNGPTEDGHSIPKREILYPQRNHFSSMQMTVPCENNFEPRDSYVPKVELLNEYFPSKVVNTSERKLNTWLLSSTQENSFHTPERKVRRSNTYLETEQGSMATQEMSMDDSPSYGSFTTLMKEGSSEEQMKVTSVRRSNRLRNQKKSPLSAVRTISK